jgi:hypothetical protein
MSFLFSLTIYVTSIRKLIMYKLAVKSSDGIRCFVMF